MSYEGKIYCKKHNPRNPTLLYTKSSTSSTLNDLQRIDESTPKRHHTQSKSEKVEIPPLQLPEQTTISNHSTDETKPHSPEQQTETQNSQLDYGFQFEESQSTQPNADHLEKKLEITDVDSSKILNAMEALGYTEVDLPVPKSSPRPLIQPTVFPEDIVIEV